jgi:hypothetical protein
MTDFLLGSLVPTSTVLPGRVASKGKHHHYDAGYCCPKVFFLSKNTQALFLVLSMASLKNSTVQTILTPGELFG